MTRPAPRPQFLAVQQVAAIMGVSKMTVYRLLHSGELPGYRIGRSFRVDPVDLRAYLGDARTDRGMSA